MIESLELKGLSMKNTLLISVLLLSSFTLFAGEAQIARFEKWLTPLEKSLLTESAEEAADNLIVGKARVLTFNLQALGKLYGGEDKKFSKFKKDFKELEDGIGEYKKWRDILEEAQDRGASSSKIQKLKKKMEAGKGTLVKLLDKEDWVEAKKIKKYRKFLKKYEFGSYKKDKKIVLNLLIDDLEKIAGTEFDMTILEHGNGLHELRREIRWYLIKAKVLNGLVQYNDNPGVCSIEKYAKLPFQPIANSKYAVLYKSALEKSPCLISKCLFLALVQKVDQFGDFKDQIESDLNLQDILTDDTPVKYIDELNKLYDEMKETQVLEAMAGELKSCL